MRLRDLLKFEFFFAEKEVFRSEIRRSSRCTIRLGGAPRRRGAANVILRRVKPFHAHRILRPFLEAYRVVADALETAIPPRPSTFRPSSRTARAR